jgi:DNA repair exonuclease SbcCD ATPase subunit
MGKSSGHIGGGSGGNTSHNSREKFSFSQVFFDEQNQVNRNQQDAMKMFRDLLRVRSEKYTERTGQKLQKNSVTHLSTIINLLPEHELKDLDPIVKFLEEKLDTKVFQTAIHRDEGKLVHKTTGEILTSGKHFFADPKTEKHYFDKEYTKPLDLDEYKVEKNYHAHIEFMGLDSDGKSIRRELNKRFLVKYQDFLAKTLGMERGQKSQSYTKEQMTEINAKLKKIEEYPTKRDYAKAFNQAAKDLGYFIDKSKKTKRLDTHDFKAMKARENEILAPVLAKQKDLKAEISKLRAELKESGAGRSEYAELEQLNCDLKAKIKQKDLTIEELKLSVSSLGTEKTELQDKIKEKALAIEELQEKISSITTEKTELLNENVNLTQKVADAEEKLAQVDEIAYKKVENWNQDTESIEVEKVPFKNLYEKLSVAIEEKKERLVELEVQLEANEEYIVRLDEGYSQLEVQLFGKDEGRKVEEIVGRVSLLSTVIEKASNFMKLTVEQFVKYFSTHSEPKTDENELKSNLEGKSSSEIEKTLKSHPKDDLKSSKAKTSKRRRNC